MTDDPRITRLREFFESLTPATLERLDQFYAPEARFKDPFNDVSGVPAIRAIFDGMYRQVDRPRFVVTRSFGQGDECIGRDHGLQIGVPRLKGDGCAAVLPSTIHHAVGGLAIDLKACVAHGVLLRWVSL